MYRLLRSCPCWLRCKQLLKHPSTAVKFRLYLEALFLPFLFLCSLCCPSEMSHRQQIEIANIHISAEPSLDLFPNILSVSICLQFFLHSFPPSLPPSSFALIGFRSYSTGRLLAPFHQNLATAVHICPHTSRSLAFCLWMDGTEFEGRDKVKRGRRREWERKQLNAQIQMNMHHYG